MADLTEQLETEFARGERAAYQSMLVQCLSELRTDAGEPAHQAWVLERVRLVSMLRRLCDEYGDNDWNDDAHLPDVIEKHLINYWPANDPNQ